MKIAFCDDEKRVLEVIKSIVINEEFTADYFDNPEDLKKSFLEQEYDAVFLDIEMPQISGMELAAFFRSINRFIYIVFLTNRGDLVFQSFEIQPYEFIKKENMAERLPVVLDRLLARLREDMVFCNPLETDTGKKILAREIEYIECQKHYLKVFHDGEIALVRGRISDIEKKLKPYGFIRVHNGFLVNTKYIHKFSNTKIIMESKQEIPIGRKWKPDIMEEYKKMKRKYLYGRNI